MIWEEEKIYRVSQKEKKKKINVREPLSGSLLAAATLGDTRKQTRRLAREKKDTGLQLKGVKE